MSRRIKRCLAVILVLILFASGVNYMPLSIPADEIVQESTTYSEETASEQLSDIGEEVTETPTEAVTEEQSSEENIETQDEETTIAFESTDNILKRITDTPLKASANRISTYSMAPAAEGKHEAEDADSFTKGAASSDHTIPEDSKYSNGKAVGEMNAWPDDGRSYLTKTVNAERPGKFKLMICYSSGNQGGTADWSNGTDMSKPTNIDVRINNGNWVSVEAYPTEDGKTAIISTDITLNRGDNTIDITGASNIWYTEGEYWQWADIDYFEITAPLAEGKHEAEDAHSFTASEGSGDHTVVESDSFSNGEAIGNMNIWPDDGRAYLSYEIYAESAGIYELQIGYATSNANETNIDVRVNSASWDSVKAPSTGGAETVKTISTTVTLKKGSNTIDITGASNVWYDEGYEWQWANIDYFELSRQVDTSNIALDKPVRTSGDREDNPAENAVDGYDGSRWGGKGSQSDNWFEIDLQALYEIDSVMISFQQAYPTDFEIQVSRDRTTWTTTNTVTGWAPENYVNDNTAQFQWDSNVEYHGKARYIRINASKLFNSGWGLSIWEFVVKGNKLSADLSDVTLNKDTTASTSNENKAEWAVDGKDTSRWGSKTEANPWYQINLGKEYELYSVDLKFERAYPVSFNILISSDGNSWTTIKEVKDWTEPGTARNLSADKRLGYSFKLDSPTKASYIKIEVVERADSGWGLSIWEFEAWGKDLTLSDYWNNIDGKSYGIYPVDGLYNSESAENKINADLVQGDVLGTDDTYEVVYEPGKYIYFYVNPYEYYINHTTDTICWSSSNSGNGLWGATFHDEGIADYQSQQQATVKYQLPSSLDFGNKDYVETEIGCQIYGTTDGKPDFENGAPLEGKTPKFSTKFKVKVIKPHSISIEDTIETNGSLTVKNAESGAKYEWQRSSDGNTGWENVSETRDDLTILYDNGKTVNVAMDLGGGMYYRVRKAGTDEWSLPYRVIYYNNVQNGDFEFPAMSTPIGAAGSVNVKVPEFPFGTQQGDEQQYPNGYPGMVWKTTGPGWYSNGRNKVGHDIEIVNGRRLKTTAEAAQVYEFSVTYDEMYKDNSHGDQFAELNCENVGALYQDILTTPGSECYWDLDHAGRWNQNTMYVVAMSSKNAKNYATAEQLEEFIEAVKDSVTENTKDSYAEGITVQLTADVSATVWKVRSDSVTAGQWEHHSGKYIVPGSDENYLTRFFFVSAEGGKRTHTDTENRTVGNLLDNITFEMKKSYSIKYYVDDETTEKYSTTGVVEPYDKVKVPDTISGYDLSKYTLYKAELNGKSYYLDEATRLMTVAYDHDDLKLYYRSSTIAVTKKVQGLQEIPDGYSIRFDLIKNNQSIANIILDRSQFNKIEEQDEEQEESYFATIDFDGTELGLSDGDSCSITETVVPVTNDYYLSQVQTDNDTYSLSVSELKNSEFKRAYDFTYHTQSANTSTFVNIYKPTYKITINKQVDGNIGNITKPFEFTLNLKKGNNNIDVLSYDNQNAELSTNSTGNYSFKLKNNESITFTILDDCIATVKEADDSSDGYVTSWDISGVDTSDVTDGGKGFTTSESISKDITATCTNTKNAPAATGLFDNAKPFILLICCALLALTCFAAGRKGWFHNIIHKGKC